jgi:hypothetical protein
MSDLTELGQDAIAAVSRGVADGAPLVKCQLLASAFYEAPARTAMPMLERAMSTRRTSLPSSAPASRSTLVSRTLFFSHSSRAAICRTDSFEIPSASPIALSVAPAFRAFAIALLRPTPCVISCCILGITVLATRLRSFMRAAALARASFSCRIYEG